MNEQVQVKDRTLEVLVHLLGLAGFTGIPFMNVIAPLILWLWKRETDPAVDAHGKEALNFQISMAIYTIISVILIFAIVGFFLLGIVLVLNLIFTIMAAVKASRGEFYRYPLSIRFLNTYPQDTEKPVL